MPDEQGQGQARAHLEEAEGEVDDIVCCSINLQVRRNLAEDDVQDHQVIIQAQPLVEARVNLAAVHSLLPDINLSNAFPTVRAVRGMGTVRSKPKRRLNARQSSPEGSWEPRGVDLAEVLEER